MPLFSGGRPQASEKTCRHTHGEKDEEEPFGRRGHPGRPARRRSPAASPAGGAKKSPDAQGRVPVMSQCPYGVQVVNAIKDVVDKMGPDIDFVMGSSVRRTPGQLTAMVRTGRRKHGTALRRQARPGQVPRHGRLPEQELRKSPRTGRSARRTRSSRSARSACKEGPEGKALLTASNERAVAKRPARTSSSPASRTAAAARPPTSSVGSARSTRARRSRSSARTSPSRPRST